ANGRVTLTFDVGRLEGVDPRDPNLPPEVARYPEIRFSTGASWQAMATEYAKIVDSHASSAAVQAIVDKLIAGKSSVADKETAILEYVGSEVRYTGIEFGEAAIVPHDPAEVLNKKYGDCKDKATLLVTMLRAAGIEAYVALLNVGGRMDVPEDLPGMGLFDHAIVYVPGPPAIWIDATDRYARLGQLPADDQRRLALIARKETTALTRTMESTSRDNVLREFREIRLGVNGPASVTERTQPTGVFESHYRGYYADKPDKETREGLQGYVKGQYISDKLTTVSRTDPADLSRQFELTIECEKAKRGYTDLDAAEAAIRLDSLFQRLPDELKRREDADKKKQDGDEKPKPPRTADWWLNEAFSAEWNYRIVPPAGFIPKELPKDQTILVGPAVLTERFAAEKEGVVTAHLVFDAVKRRYTAAEATDLRNKVAELSAGSAILVSFEPQAAVLLREGKVKEALAAYRALIAQHPNEPVHHLQVAKVLLEAGMGEAARAEARQAVKLDPTSALAEKTLAMILKYDLVGREERPGSDWAGAAEAYRAAAKLDPDDDTAAGNLAILYEYDSVGRRYGSQSHMKEAIAEYQKLGQEKLNDLDIGNNLTFALFYGGESDAAIKAAQALNPQPAALIAASEAVLHGSKAGLAEANKRSSGEQAYKQTAHTAGEMLMNIRQYQLAADFLEAGANGENAAHDIRLASLLRGAQHHEDLHFADKPEDVVRRAFLLSMDPNVTQATLDSIYSRNAQAVLRAENEEERKKNLEAGKQLNSQLARDDSSLDVTVDIMANGMDPKGEGGDETGYRERAQVPGGSEMTFFVVREDGHYRLLDDTERPNSIGLEMLERIDANKLASAKTLLDWLREDQHLEGGDDPFGGPVFPRFWTKGQAADARRMKLAAGAILVGTRPTAAKGIAVLEEGQKTAVGEREKTNILIGLAEGYSFVNDFAKLEPVAAALLAQEPLSRQAFLWRVEALMGLNRHDEAIRLADERLKQLDGDQDALLMKMEIEANRGNFTAARAWAQKIVAQGKETAGILNNIAWYALYLPKVEQADIDTAIKSTQLSKEDPHILHTVACLYVETGRIKEAHDLLVRAMDQLNLDEPNDDFWYAFGRIAEQYGERDAALADYRKLKKPTEPLSVPTSSWRLAQNRLKAMGETSSQ
ncbi:MAG: transglutaminase domain-containing protein, partial [Terracidiphilus sp.]